jgi:hypothetical protein
VTGPAERKSLGTKLVRIAVPDTGIVAAAAGDAATAANANTNAPPVNTRRIMISLLRPLSRRSTVLRSLAPRIDTVNERVGETMSERRGDVGYALLTQGSLRSM